MDFAEAGQKDGSQKVLVAIVFTDVVGYARHANLNEAKAVENFQRDLEIIERAAQQCGGSLIKTMGDGTLLRFSAAVDAVRCALVIQRELYDLSKTIPKSDVLIHRMGVHLGDVMISGDDVFGDGVNVASRLQVEARPASIYMSRPVYETVRGKVNFAAKYVGPRHLKGIAEPVSVWEAPPLGQPLDGGSIDLASPAFSGLTESQITARKMVVNALIGLTFLAALVVPAVFLLRASASGKPHSNAEIARKGSLIEKIRAANNPPPPVTTNVLHSPFSDSVLSDELQNNFRKCDFAAMVNAVEKSDYAQAQSGKDLMMRYQSFADLYAGLRSELLVATDEAPITVTQDPVTLSTADFYRGPDGNVLRKTASATSVFILARAPKREVIALGQAIATRGEVGGTDRGASRNNSLNAAAFEALEQDRVRFLDK